VDCLIVGRGIAGSVLALELLERGRRVLVVDPEAPDQTASRVAAGILNPVTGKRLVKSWRAETLLPAAREWYRRRGRELGASFFTDVTIQRLCKDGDEIARWEKRLGQPAYQPFLGRRCGPGALHPALLDALGSFAIDNAAVLDTGAFLDASLRRLREAGAHRTARVAYGELDVGPEGARWAGVAARRVVFCEGWRALENPWFDWLPYEPARGEVIEVETDLDLPRHVYNRQKWLLPLGGGRLRVGSTWAWEHLDAPPSAQGRAALLAGLRAMVCLPADPPVVATRSGVRPASKDRLPYLGRHPTQPALAIFNGMGSKGTLYAPWLAGQLAGHLFDGEELAREVDLQRVRESARQ
jgi:glycine/D-amino acid oxidase-like deaminating enzyme